MKKKWKKIAVASLASLLLMTMTIPTFAMESKSIEENTSSSQSEQSIVQEESSNPTSSNGEVSSVQEESSASESASETKSETLPESESLATSEEPPQTTQEEPVLLVLQPTILQGDKTYTKEKLANLAIVFSSADELTQITDQYTIEVVDGGGYDNNTIGEYAVSFKATNKATGQVLEKTETLAVKSLEEIATGTATPATRAFGVNRSLPSAADTNNWEFDTTTNPSGEQSGYGFQAAQSAFHGYRFAQGVRESGAIHFYGNTTNAFYRYHAFTTNGWGIPVYCVEPLVQDKNGNGNWMGGAGWAYESVSNDNGATGNFHAVTGSWALANEQQRRVASAISYFSRPEAMMIDGNSTEQMETYYVAAQIMIWEALDGVLDTDPSSPNFMEALPDVPYYDRNLAAMTSGNYHNYEFSGYQACIIGNDVPDAGYPTLQAYETLKQRLRDYYSLPDFTYPSSVQAQVGKIKLPSPSSGEGVQLSGTPSVLASMDWSNFAGNSNVEVDTSTISAGYVTVKAKTDIPKETPTVSTFSKAGATDTTPKAYFLSLYGNQYAYNGEGQGQTKMTFATIDPVKAYLAFYTEDTGQIEIAKVDENDKPILIPVTFEIYDPNGNLVDVVETDAKTGIATTKNLPINVAYPIKEKESPLGYTGLFEGVATITADGEIVKVTAKNTKQKLELIKVDKDNPDLVLEGAEFTLSVFENGKWKVVDKKTTGKDGKVVFENVYNGDKWKWEETKNPLGYVKENNSQEFAITEKDTLLSFTVKNTKEQEDKKDSYGTVDFKVGGGKNKGFPQTGDVAQSTASEEITETETIQTDGAEPTSNSFAPTITKNGKEYTLKNVTYAKQEGEKTITKEVSYENLEFQKVPQTIEVEQDGKTVTLELVNADYTQTSTPVKAEYEQDFGYTVAPPKAAATKTFTVTDETTGETKEVEGTLVSLDQVEGYTWRSTNIAATFYGSAGDSGFVFGNTTIPYNANAPVYQGYESAILDYLGLSEKSYRIVGSSWTDDAFVQVNGQSVRRANLKAEMRTARWVAKYSSDETAKAEFSATATYSSNPNAQDGKVEYLATATYVLQAQAGTNTVKTVVVITGIIILAIALAVLFFLLSKRKKEREEQEEVDEY